MYHYHLHRTHMWGHIQMKTHHIRSTSYHITHIMSTHWSLTAVSSHVLFFPLLFLFLRLCVLPENQCQLQVSQQQQWFSLSKTTEFLHSVATDTRLQITLSTDPKTAPKVSLNTFQNAVLLSATPASNVVQKYDGGFGKHVVGLHRKGKENRLKEQMWDCWRRTETVVFITRTSCGGREDWLTF